MSEATRQTRSHLMALFERHGFNPRRDLGQNFLIDINIVEYVVKEARLDKQDVVLEVGAGTGGMTTFMAAQAAEVVSVELDTNMYALASEATAGFDNVTLLNCDILRNKNNLSDDVMSVVREKLEAEKGRRLKLVSNLPYNVATPVVSNLVASDVNWSRMIITIQLELGLRMTALPSRNHYGALSVWLQSQCSVKLLKRLPPTVFWPRPKVNSAIVRLAPDGSRRKDIADRAFLQDFVRRLFHQRRKFLRSVLVGMYRKQLGKPEVDAILAAMNMAENARAEEQDVSTLVTLANRVQAAIAEKTDSSNDSTSGMNSTDTTGE